MSEYTMHLVALLAQAGKSVQMWACDKCRKDYPIRQIKFYPQWGPDGENEETAICPDCEHHFIRNGEWRR